MAITNTLGSGPGEDRDVEYGCGISCWVYRQQLFPRLHRPQPEANPNPRYAVSQMADRMIADDPSPCTRRAVRPKNRFNPSHPLALSTGITTSPLPKTLPLGAKCPDRLLHNRSCAARSIPSSIVDSCSATPRCFTRMAPTLRRWQWEHSPAKT